MQFKEIKQNYTVHILNKTNLQYEEGKVVNISLPRYENKIGQTPSMVVDVTLTDGNKNVTYVFPDSSSKAYCGDQTFYLNKADLIADVKAMQKASEQMIADIDKHRETVRMCHSLLGELDTDEKARQEMESRLSKMEGRFDNVESLLKQIANRQGLSV